MRPYLEKLSTKNRTGGVAQGEGPEFKAQYKKNKKYIFYIHSSIESTSGIFTFFFHLPHSCVTSP
jgi:hypothetical protein